MIPVDILSDTTSEVLDADRLEASKDMDGAVNDFAYREVQRLGRRLFRLGLSGSFGLDEAGCCEALERIQYVFWHPRMKGLTPALREALSRDRERYTVSAGPLLGYFPGAVRRAAEAAMRTLGVDWPSSGTRGRYTRWGYRSTTGRGQGSLPGDRSSTSS